MLLVCILHVCSRTFNNKLTCASIINNLLMQFGKTNKHCEKSIYPVALFYCFVDGISRCYYPL